MDREVINVDYWRLGDGFFGHSGLGDGDGDGNWDWDWGWDWYLLYSRWRGDGNDSFFAWRRDHPFAGQRTYPFNRFGDDLFHRLRLRNLNAF